MPWSVIRHIAGLDAGSRVTRGLDRIGIEHYNPLMSTSWVSRGRKVVRTSQLFPSYMFVSLSNQWSILKGVTGVLNVLSDSAGPIAIDDSIVAGLRASEQDGLHQPQIPPPRFVHGQPVFLTAGAFVDKIAIYDGMSGTERSAVLLRILGKQQRMFVPNEYLSEVAANTA